MATLTDALKADGLLGYTFANSYRSLNVLWHLSHCQWPVQLSASTQQRKKWVDWTGMKAKVPKRHSLAIQASTAWRFDPKLYLNDQSISFIGNRTIKFLGGPFGVPMTNQDHKQHLKEKLRSPTPQQSGPGTSYKEAEAASQSALT